jgi:hypothetical protein
MSHNLFNKAPALCPWYFNDTTPKLKKNGQALRWHWLEKIGKEYFGAALLEDRKKTCFGIVETYTYILPNARHDQFLIWSKDMSSPPEFTMSLFTADDLQPIARPKESIFSLRERNRTDFFFDCPPRSILSFGLHPGVEQLDLTFPGEVKSFPDFCIVTQIPGLYPHGQKTWNETAILLVKPGEDTIAIFPQDWFNQSDADFGYEWITRAIVHPKTGLIHGQGIRMDDFILDHTNRQLQRR